MRTRRTAENYGPPENDRYPRKENLRRHEDVSEKVPQRKQKGGRIFEGLLFSFHVHLNELFGYILRESVGIYITYQSCSNGALDH